MTRNGFVLPLALVVMVVLSVVAVTALHVTTADLIANRSMRIASRALYAAEAGADETVARWNAGAYSVLSPGDSVTTGWSRLPDGAWYRSSVLRVDDGSAPAPMFRIRTEGRPSRTAAARRDVIVMVEAVSGQACCRAVVAIRGRMRVRAPNKPKGWKGPWTPPPQVDGRDHVPTAWAGFCPVPAPGIPGILVDRTNNLTFQAGASAEGTPPLEEDRTLGPSLADVLGDATYDELAALANVRFTSGTTRLRGTIGPSAINGACRTSDEMNWGAPTLPASPCWDYLPVIHARGNLRIDATGQGQGILLVDGDLNVTSTFDFYGIVVVKGQATLRGGSSVTGGLVAVNRADGNGQSLIRDESSIRYSACAASRASAALGGGARKLAGRHWFEVP